MYLFKDQNEIEISLNCKLCLKEIKFTISAEEYKKIKKFPFKRESVHGTTPKHRLVVYINKNLDIDNFKIEEVEVDEEKATQDEELTRQVLSNLGLSNEEIELYVRITGRDAVSLGELAILADKPKEATKKMADLFVKKGLFREIVGATPHYTALPPYAALVSQLEDFHTYIVDFKKNAPIELNKSFSRLEAQADGIKNIKEYTDFMLDLKEKTLSDILTQRKKFDQTASVIEEITGLQDFILNLEGDAKKVMDKQTATLEKQFEGLGDKISKAMDSQVEDLTGQFDKINAQITGIVESQIDNFKKQFNDMKSRVSKNLQKLRLGVVQQAVDQVIETSFTEWLAKITENLNAQLGEIQKASKDGLVKTKIGLNKQLGEIQKVQSDGLKNMTDQFNKELISKLKDSIESTVSNIKGITSTTAESGDAIKQLFGDISKNFSKAVTMAEEKLGGMSEGVFESFDNLKDTFSSKIVEALNNILNDILERLEVSEMATKQFWEQAAQGGGGAAALTMKDIWFIRSIEGAKAHVNDEVSQAKMRVLIVTPQITDINLDSIKACKKHINIRIATNTDLSNPAHVAILEELTKMQNITVRNRKLQNLWGINRDYEEVILCVISKTDTGTEIAGIGSIIQEHIKIFVPILEDAWVGAQKGFAPSMGTATVSEPIKATEAPKPTKATEAPKPTKATEAPKPTKPKEAPKPKPSQKLKKVKTPAKAVSSISAGTFLPKDASMEQIFDHLANNADNMTGAQIASILDQLKNNIESQKGYSGVIAPINLAIADLKFVQNRLNDKEIKQLINKVKFWRKKLHV
ncbi:MAG: hypothetical protein EU529_13595 [Promethearchaeota archaeon]|nr:MAG: hypothetical protein EU529_13595 [Candidatus Lokiarchaeota archaeon]